MLIFPVRTDRPLRTNPNVNYALILINVFVFALQELSRLNYISPTFFDAYRLYPDHPTLLTFITYGFLHGGWFHLVMNMIFLYIFGNNVSDKLGQIPYLLFYLSGCIFAGVGYVMLASPQPGGFYAPVVGASGAVFAVTGAFLVLLPRSNITLFYFLFIFGFFEVPALFFVALQFGQDVFFQVSGADGVAHSAHIAGALFGFFVTMGLLACRLVPRDDLDLLGMISRWNRRRQFRSAVAQGWDPYGPHAKGGKGGIAGGLLGSRSAPPPPDAHQVMVVELRAQVSEAIAHRNLPSAATLYAQLLQLDRTQVMNRSAQLDIANHFAEQADFQQAADAYEQFLKHYPQAPEHAHIGLLAGVIYSRYLNTPLKALPLIEHALPRLTSPRDVELAKAELATLKPAAK